jgi:hypothetical protein
VTNLGCRNDTDVGYVDGTDAEFSDEELCALALAADPDQPLGTDAVPLNLYPAFGAGFLPTWYMPAVMSRTSGTWRAPVVLAIVVALLAIDAFGLCITYGQLVVA